MIQTLRLGIDIGGTKAAYGVVNHEGNILAQGNVSTRGYANVDLFVETLYNAIKQNIPAILYEQILSIGVGAPNGNYYTGNIEFAAVNSGLNHLIRPMMYDAYHHVLNLSNPDGPVKKYTVTGNICETDTFAADRDLPEIREGDILALCNAGAYGFEMSSNYNSRYKPAEVLIREGKSSLIRKRDNFEDLIRNQIG